jgi:hypothetical protein
MEYKECGFVSIHHSSRYGLALAATSDAHDPVDWVFEFGHFDRERWRRNWQNLFDNYDLIRNNRKTIKIVIEMDHSNARHEVNG